MPTLREARLQRLLSIRALAKKAGVVPNTVHLVETGQRAPQLLTVYRLCRALDVEPDDVTEIRDALAAAADRRGRQEKENG